MEKKNELISIIVPIYNVARYLDECIQSIVDQTYNNIQIILVNDGSTDRCEEICNNWKLKDERIQIINKSNGGLSDARNFGLKVATGEYIVFVDSDDYIDKYMVEKLYKSICDSNTMISQCGVTKINNQKETLETYKYGSNQVLSSKKFLVDAYNGGNTLNTVVWNKMYNRIFFDKYIFPKGKIHEDEFVTYKIVYDADKVSIVSDCLYYYRENNQSIMGKKYNINRLAYLEALKERIIFFKEKREQELLNRCEKMYLNALKSSYFKTKKHIPNSKNVQKKIISEYRKNFIKNITKLNVCEISKNMVFYVFPGLMYIIKKGKIV